MFQNVLKNSVPVRSVCRFGSVVLNSGASVFSKIEPKNKWTKEEIQSIHDSPIMDLLYFGVTLSSF